MTRRLKRTLSFILSAGMILGNISASYAEEEILAETPVQEEAVFEDIVFEETGFPDEEDLAETESAAPEDVFPEDALIEDEDSQPIYEDTVQETDISETFYTEEDHQTQLEEVFEETAIDAGAAGDVYQTGSCGGNLTYTLTVNSDGQTYTLTIDGTGNMAEYSWISDVPWSSVSQQITTVNISSEVTSIGAYAFSTCRNLKSLTLPEGVTSIGEYAFLNCSGLTSFIIPQGIKSIEYGVFYNCAYLESIVIPEGVTSIGGAAFYNCGSLKTLTIPEGVTSIGASAFYGCSSLTSITIPENAIISNEKTFGYCKSLTSITLPENLTSIGDSMFFNCTNLSEIHFSDELTSIGPSAFGGCTSLTSFIIPEGVTSIGRNAFGGSNLTSITIPDGITDIRDATFYECGNLTSITIPASVTSIEEKAFEECNKLQTVYYQGSQDSWESIPIGTDNTCLTAAQLKIVPQITSIEFQADQITMFNHETYELHVNFQPEGALSIPLKWSSTDTAVAEVSSGIIRAKQIGTTIIKAFNIKGTFVAECEVKVIDSYPIHYVLNGGINSEANPENYLSDTKTLDLHDASRTGYDFAGWYTDSSFTEQITAIAEGSRGEITLHAKWTPVSYSIRYMLEDGENDPNNPSEYNIESDIALKDPHKDGYHFIGWYSDPSYTVSVSEIPAGSMGDLLFYAKWQPLSQALVPNKAILDLSAGTQEQIQCAVSPAGSYSGELRWTSDHSEIATVDNTGLVSAIAQGVASITVASEETGLKAVVTVAVTEDPSTLLLITLDQNEAEMAVGGTLNLTASRHPETAINENLIWQSSNDAVVTVTDGTLTALSAGTAVITVASEDGELTAACNVTVTEGYSVRFHENGGSGQMEDQSSLLYGIDHTLAENAFTKTGYTFSGWNSASDGTGNPFEDKGLINQSSQLEDGLYHLYAQWIPITYKVAFNANGNSSVATLPSPLTCSYDQAVSLPDFSGNPGGRTFTGWNTKADGTGEDYANQASIMNLASKDGAEVILYAQWKYDAPIITAISKKEGELADNKGGLSVSVQVPEYTDGINLYRSADVSGEYVLAAAIEDVSSGKVNYDDENLLNGTAYSYYAAAFKKDNAGNAVEMASSEIVTCKTAERPDIFVRLDVTAGTSSKAVSVWIQNNGKLPVMLSSEEPLIFMPYMPEDNETVLSHGTCANTVIPAGESVSVPYTLEDSRIANAETAYAVLVYQYDGMTYSQFVYTFPSRQFLFPEDGDLISDPDIRTIRNTAQGVELTWNKVEGATQYQVFRIDEDGEESAWEKIGDETTFTDTEVASEYGKKYTFYVMAFHDTHFSEGSQAGIIRLAQPVLTSVSATDKGTTVKWNKVTNADGYYIYRKTGSGKYVKAGSAAGASTGSFADKAAAKGNTVYTYYVEAYAKKDGLESVSAPSNTKSGSYAAYVTPAANTPAQNISLNSATETQASQTITNMKGDLDLKDSSYRLLQLKAGKITKTSIKVSWTKVPGAKKYVLYFNKCGKKYKKEKVLTKTSYTKKKLKKGTYYKFMVAALGANGKVIASSKTVHVATSGGKNGNVQSIKATNVSKGKVSLQVGSSFTLKTKTTAQKGTKVKQHRKIAYESTNPAIASVSSNGKITAKRNGKCYVYAYAQNGVAAKITVSVWGAPEYSYGGGPVLCGRIVTPNSTSVRVSTIAVSLTNYGNKPVTVLGFFGSYNMKSGVTSGHTGSVWSTYHTYRNYTIYSWYTPSQKVKVTEQRSREMAGENVVINPGQTKTFYIALPESTYMISSGNVAFDFRYGNEQTNHLCTINKKDNTVFYL